ncbi:hypothetical protein NPIL_598721 [Nephila pilipes]|uniref:Uncharacterized protein n=1 Tax=Nephila pilipes TaxID=299642 RepID=A0A8X6N5R4_NEPPI|nr:hypothetical protein NPIL_598721 [Nephila pilipes]
MELAQSMELGDENYSRLNPSVTIDDSQENCEIQQNLENVIRKFSKLTGDLSILIKNLETDTAFSPVYTEHRSSLYRILRTIHPVQ